MGVLRHNGLEAGGLSHDRALAQESERAGT